MLPRYGVGYDITPTNCWIPTTHQPNFRGYVPIRHLWRQTYLHRVMFEQYHGAIPVDFYLKNLCGYKCCCNPDHWKLIPDPHKRIDHPSPSSDTQDSVSAS